jgi:hypothetical protein
MKTYEEIRFMLSVSDKEANEDKWKINRSNNKRECLGVRVQFMFIEIKL